MSDVSFEIDRENFNAVSRIASRAVPMFAERGKRVTKQHVMMDLTAVHANGCPMRFEDLLHADDFNFAHDVFGIYRHLDRETGHLQNCFVPRFAA